MRDDQRSHGDMRLAAHTYLCERCTLPAKFQRQEITFAANLFARVPGLDPFSMQGAFMSALRMFIPITTVDAALRLVYGLATAETEDRAGEICDYASTHAYRDTCHSPCLRWLRQAGVVLLLCF